MNIIQRFIPASNKDTRPGIKMAPKYITIHETDNTSARANAEAHARLQENGNNREASWHLQIDESYAIQSIPFDEVAWAAGDSRNGPGNRSSIHLEICVNSDGNYKKAVSNAAEVTKQLMKQFNIPLDHVVQHNHWSGKNCPSIMRSGRTDITWGYFINLIADKKEGWKLENGKWFFYKNGALVKNDWAQDSKKKLYYLGEDGVMAVNRWIRWKGKWYYVGNDGAMLTGKINVKGKPYHLRSDGTLIMTDPNGVIKE